MVNVYLITYQAQHKHNKRIETGNVYTVYTPIEWSDKQLEDSPDYTIVIINTYMEEVRKIKARELIAKDATSIIIE